MTDNRTTELLPCPMCGAAWPSVQVRWIGFTHTHNGAFSAGYRGECCLCGLTTRAFNDESQATAAWNTRAELGSGTCKNVSKFEQFRCGECGASLMLETYDGDYTLEVGDVACAPAYCPNCGAKVVDE